MPESITEPMPPEELNPAPLGPLSGDYKDDDSAVYEADFEAAPHGPVKQSGVPAPVKEIKRSTRILHRSVTVGAGADPLMLFPADVNRRSLIIQPIGTGTAEFVIASSKSDCYSGAQFHSDFSGIGVSFDLSGHTGALWVYSTSANATSVNGIAVTD